MTPSGRRTRVAVVGTVVVAVALVGGCTSSTSAGHGSAVTTPAVTADGIPSDTSVLTDTDTAGATDTTAPATTTSTTPAASGLPKDTCTGAQLTVRILRAGAVPAQEIALITFTNSSTTKCTMFGFPGVSLRLAGKQLGQALRSPVSAKTVTLLPGEQAEAQITDFSTCQGALSDTVRVYPPNLTTFVDKPFELRACRFEVDPVSHSS